MYIAAQVSRKLTFLYLANDVIQNSKKKGPEFTQDFAPVIVDAFKHVYRSDFFKFKMNTRKLQYKMWFTSPELLDETCLKILRCLHIKMSSVENSIHFIPVLSSSNINWISPRFLKHICLSCVFLFRDGEEGCKKQLGRVLSIWQERAVYENNLLDQLSQVLCKKTQR